jgi:hypothetical protein
MELMLEEIPFLTTTAGGGVELMSSRANTIPPGDAVALMQQMIVALTTGVATVALASPPAQTRDLFVPAN